MSELALGVDGIVKTALEFREEFLRTGIEGAEYQCPFCGIALNDKCIIRTCKERGPHFAVFKGEEHAKDCNGDLPTEVTSTNARARTRSTDSPSDLPEALTARRTATIAIQRLNSVALTQAEIDARRQAFVKQGGLASRYTSSLLRTVVEARDLLHNRCRQKAKLAKLRPRDAAYNELFTETFKAYDLVLYGDRLTYNSAFRSERLAPEEEQKKRIYMGSGKVGRDEDGFRIFAGLRPVEPQSSSKFPLEISCPESARGASIKSHRELWQFLGHAAAGEIEVKWNAYGPIKRTDSNTFELSLASLDHLYIPLPEDRVDQSEIGS